MAPQMRTWEEMRVWMTGLLEQRTGEGVPAWKARIAQRKPADEGALRSWLAEQGVTGYAQMLLVMETFGYPDYLLAGADELIDAQYRDREHLRPVLEAILAAAPSLGDVSVGTRKTYVTLMSPRRQFAAIVPATKTRVDLGLRLEDAKPEGRLEPARNTGGGSINFRIRLESPDDVDDEVLDWLRKAYEQNR